MVVDVSLSHLLDERLRIGGTSSDNLYHVVFQVVVFRLGYVEGYPFCASHVKMGYDVEYAFHANKSKQKVLNIKQIMLLLQ